MKMLEIILIISYNILLLTTKRLCIKGPVATAKRSLEFLRHNSGSGEKKTSNIIGKAQYLI